MVDMMYSKMYIEAKIQIRTCSENITGEWSLLWGNHIFAIHQRGGYTQISPIFRGGVQNFIKY